MDWFFRLERWSKGLMNFVFSLIALAMVASCLGVAIAMVLEEGDWSLLAVIGCFALATAVMYWLARLFRRLSDRGDLQFIQRTMDWLDLFLEYWFVHPLVRRFEESAGILIPNLEQPLACGGLDEIDTQKLRQAVHQYERVVEADTSIRSAGLLVLLVIWLVFSALLSTRLSGWSLLVPLPFLSLIYLLYARTVKLVKDRLTGLRRIQRVVEAVDTLTLREKADTAQAYQAAASRELSRLKRHIRQHRIVLRTLQDDIKHLLSTDEATQQSVIYVMKALVDGSLEDLEDDLVTRQKKSSEDERRWELRKDIVLGFIFLVLGLVLGQIAVIGDIIVQVLEAFGIVP